MKSLFCLFLFVLTFSATTILAQNQVILENTFEKGTQNWEARGTGSVSISSTKKEAATGKKSLRVNGRREAWQGAQLNVTKLLSTNKTYEFTVSVRLSKKEKTDDIKMTMQRGENQFDGVGLAKVGAEGWTTFSGKFTPKGNAAYLLLYIEAGRKRTSFYIDDFKITAISAIPEQKGVLLKNDFEDSTAQNWFTRGVGVQMFSTTAGGSRSLKVTNRTQHWHGLMIDLSPLIYKGRTYQISADVKLISGETPDKLKLTIQQTNTKDEKTHVEITPATDVSDREWITLTGTYEAKTWGNNIIIYVEAEGEKTSFYLDNFELKLP